MKHRLTTWKSVLQNEWVLAGVMGVICTVGGTALLATAWRIVAQAW